MSVVAQAAARTRRTARSQAGAVVWWIGFVVCAFYGGYALYMGVVGMLSLLGVADGAPHRAAPLVFVLHALAGAVALIGGSLQFNTRLRSRWPAAHRAIGRAYVGSVWTASAAGLWIAVALEASAAARLGFGVLAALWFAPRRSRCSASARVRSLRMARGR
jgi:hypothetical protein